MVAGDILRTRAHPWLRSNGRDALRILAPIPVLIVAWWIRNLTLTPLAWASLCGYACVNLLLAALLRYPRLRHRSHIRRGLFCASVVSDALVGLVLLFEVGALSGVVFALSFVYTLKVFSYQRAFRWILLAPMLAGPLYLTYLVLELPLFRSAGLITWGTFLLLVGGSASATVITFWGLLRRQGEQRRLQQQQEASRASYEERIAELESVTNDLRAHIRAQQTLEEGLRAVTGSLSLDDVLRQILDSTMHMLRPERVAGAALTLQKGERFEHQLLTLDTQLPESWVDRLAEHVILSRGTLLVSNTATERGWASLAQSGIESAISVPLVTDDGQVVGALSVVSRLRQAFSPAEMRHMNSFGFQACVAIRNAELHSQVQSQWALLEAVLRDLGDGLVVYDQQSNIVLTNPVARRVLMDESESAVAMQGLLTKLVADVQQDASHMLWCELQQGTKGDEHGRFYQAFASQTKVRDASGNHVAVVLHDITSQKAEEQARTEFISMVSHELRNPLHTLGGFLKVVLQGRAGALTALQHEFLHTAEEQVDKLNGRINELLEFNRLDAGRLRLVQEWSDLPLLAAATTSALVLQAEQAGLTLINQIPDSLPELLMDSKRIGQVLTNLIENAIKATPPPGTISLAADVLDRHVRVMVTDTGVGISEVDIRKIFDPFYGRSSRSNLYGVHLGLGLSICQQIIEGHGGRISVESEEGRGSKFTFTLPLVAREQELALAVV